MTQAIVPPWIPPSNSPITGLRALPPSVQILYIRVADSRPDPTPYSRLQYRIDRIQCTVVINPNKILYSIVPWANRHMARIYNLPLAWIRRVIYLVFQACQSPPGTTPPQTLFLAPYHPDAILIIPDRDSESSLHKPIRIPKPVSSEGSPEEVRPPPSLIAPLGRIPSYMTCSWIAIMFCSSYQTLTWWSLT